MAITKPVYSEFFEALEAKDSDAFSDNLGGMMRANGNTSRCPIQPHEITVNDGAVALLNFKKSAGADAENKLVFGCHFRPIFFGGGATRRPIRWCGSFLFIRHLMRINRHQKIFEDTALIRFAENIHPHHCAALSITAAHRHRRLIRGDQADFPNRVALW